MISRARSYTPSVEAMLFGNILGVDRADLLVVAAVLVVSTILLLVYYRPLLFHTFDSEVAQVQGVPTGLVSIVFAFLLAAVIISSMQVLGVTLISAVLIMPATIARMLTVSFGRMMVLSVLLGSVSAGLGIYVSFYLDIASGASIILLQTTVFLTVLAWTSLKHKG